MAGMGRPRKPNVLKTGDYSREKQIEMQSFYYYLQYHDKHLHLLLDYILSNSGCIALLEFCTDFLKLEYNSVAL